MTFQVSHLAGVLFTGLLLPRLAATPGSRVLTTSSMINPGRAHRPGRPGPFPALCRQFAAYADSKLAGILLVRQPARRVADGAAGARSARASVRPQRRSIPA
jgi:NAD(P)-dependent dehydrogenase (short-subunit alcohol dehydrogenase family)